MTPRRFSPASLPAVLLALGGAAPAGPVAEVDLASETAWTLRIDGGPPRPVKVPGGGWNSDRQSPRVDLHRDVRDHVVYRRRITIPKTAADKVVKILFGAVNYGAEVFFDNRLVATHAGPMTPFEADVTGLASPGRSYALAVKAYHRRHYNDPQKRCHVPIGFDYTAGRPRHCATTRKTDYNAKFAYGITKYVKLAVFGEVYVKDVFIKPSVAADRLRLVVWIHNGSKAARTVTLRAALASPAGREWTYPPLPETVCALEAGKVRRVEVGPVRWGLGPDSYWWPNIPYRETYVATLHEVKLTIAEAGRKLDTTTRRFGFSEYTEGPYYYKVNGVRVNHFSDGTCESQMSWYDAYSTAPAFLPPTGPRTGCAETWRRYLRVGINTNRLSQSLPTEHMMAAADEVGFMLIPETPIRGCENQAWDDVHLPAAAREMARLCRNHPSVVRYSLSNETPAWPALIDAARAADDTRPLVFEMLGAATGRVAARSGHAYQMSHYARHPRPATDIFGMGEFAWSTNGMAAFADGARDMRINDVCYFAPWSWINYWPNFLEGMSHARHAWTPNNHPDRRSGVDGWDSHIVRYVQRSLHPYLVLDRRIDPANRYSLYWPRRVPAYLPKETIVRQVEMFNGGLKGNRFALRWRACWDRPTGPAVASGQIEDITIEPGFHATQTIRFAAPAMDADRRKLYLVTESVLAGRSVYREDRVFVHVAWKVPDVRFLGRDVRTRGNWRGSFGLAGRAVAGAPAEVPERIRLAGSGRVHVWDNATTDRRAPQSAGGAARVAACWSAEKVLTLTVDVGKGTHRRLALYLLDWDRRKRAQLVEVIGADSTRDRRPVGSFEAGQYLLWKIRGKVEVRITRQGGPDAVLSAVFLD